MPTFARTPEFIQDLKKLDPELRAQFEKVILEDFVADLRNGQRFRPQLRVKRVVSSRGVWELTWAKDGRATFEYGPEQRLGEPHVIWRRVGTHAVFKRP
jgi:hypothetical protein